MRNQPSSIFAPGLAGVWATDVICALSFKCGIYQNKTAIILSFHLNTSHALQRSCKHSGNSFTRWGCSNLINSEGSLQICRDAHPLTPDPKALVCSPPRLMCFRDSCNSHLHPYPDAGIIHTLDLVLCTAIPHWNICFLLSSLFLSLFCLPRQLVTSTCYTLQDRNEVGLLCWDMLEGVKYSATDNQRCLKLWLL